MKNPASSTDKNPTVQFDTVSVRNGDAGLIEELDDAGVTYNVQPPPSPLSGFLLSWVLPFALMAGIYYLFSRRMGGGMAGGVGGIFGVGKNKATEVKAEEVGVTYKDVGGADEAIAELQEIIQFLKTPSSSRSLVAAFPRGCC